MENSGSDCVELHINSAEGLKNVRQMGRMRTYAEAWINSSSKSEHPHTKIDNQHHRNPIWDQTLPLPLSSHPGRNPTLEVRIICVASLGRQKLVGKLSLPFSLSQLTNLRSLLLSYQLERPSGRFYGILNFSLRLQLPKVIPRFNGTPLHQQESTHLAPNLYQQGIPHPTSNFDAPFYQQGIPHLTSNFDAPLNHQGIAHSTPLNLPPYLHQQGKYSTPYEPSLPSAPPLPPSFASSLASLYSYGGPHASI